MQRRQSIISQVFIYLHHSKKSLLRDMFIDFLEQGRDRQTDSHDVRNIDQLPSVGALIGDQTHNVVMCADQELNPKSFFKVFFTDYAITVSKFFPLHPPSTLPPNPPASPHLSSCPWVVYISSLSFLFPIPFLSLPIYFMPTDYASSSLYLSPLSPPFLVK